jgi:hypothetical protein
MDIACQLKLGDGAWLYLGRVVLDDFEQRDGLGGWLLLGCWLGLDRAAFPCVL